MLLRSLTTSLMRRTTMTALARSTIPQQASCFSTTTGVVKWFDAKKGFGFVVPDDGSGDVFVHHSEVHKNGFRSLDEGENVEFEVQEEAGGRRRAVHVTGPDGVEVQGARQAQSFGGYGGNDRSPPGGGYGQGFAASDDEPLGSDYSDGAPEEKPY